MWIKICGLTSAAAVATALELQVDALGFVFSASVRRLSTERALELARSARGRARCVAVTRHPTQPLVDEILRVFAPDVLQSDLADLEALRLPTVLELLPVVRDVAAAPPRLPARLLFEGARSGAGMRSDWSVAAALAPQTQLILAGGLSPDNVAAAIAAVRPFGVDVSSGVEERPGLKSPATMAKFVRAARAAAAPHPRITEDTR
jgi:phosphoribosylanthranilate isomerase